MVLQVIEKEFNCQKSAGKGGYESDDKKISMNRRILQELSSFEKSCAKNDRHGQEKGKARSRFPVEISEEACRDRYARARNTRD